MGSTWATRRCSSEIDRRARAAGRASVLVTFDPHPLEVVNPEAAPPLLTTGPERLEILAQLPAGLRASAAVRPPPGGSHAGGVRARGAARALRRAGAGDRARPRLRPGPQRRRGDPAPAGRRAWLRRGRGGSGGFCAASTSPAAESAGRWPAAIWRTAACHAGPPLWRGRPGRGGGAPGAAARRADHQPERAVAPEALAARRRLRGAGRVAGRPRRRA